MITQPEKILLIAEDERPLARVLSLKLNVFGFQTVVTSDGEEAIEMLGKKAFNLIVLDLVMPKKDGFYVLSEMNRLGIKTPVIVASNLSQDEDIERAKKLGAVDYFIKSDMTLVDIVNKVKQYLS